jgi:hypothetical protein
LTDSDEQLTPAEEEVRRLLAEARHTGPPPPDVVARLDRVLDDLSRETDHAAPVIDLARRRRRAGSLLVAAAVVGVVGIGVSQVVNSQGGADTATSGAAERAEQGAEPRQSKNGSDAAESGGEPVAPAPTATQDKADLIELRRNRLADGLVVARRGLSSFDSKVDDDRGSADRAAGSACGADAWGRGRFVPASYGGTPAVVVFRRPVGDTQVAEVFLCGSAEPVRSVTLPAP